MEDKDCGVCGDSNAEEVDKKEYGYKYLCSRWALLHKCRSQLR